MTVFLVVFLGIMAVSLYISDNIFDAFVNLYKGGKAFMFIVMGFVSWWPGCFPSSSLLSGV